MKKPVFYGYGNSDNVISPDILRETGQWIELNAAADVHEYSMVHEICSKECSDLRSWFRSIL